MSESPLLKRTRARLARQRQQERERWETQPAALRKSMIRWVLRILGLVLLLALIAYRMSGGSFY